MTTATRYLFQGHAVAAESNMRQGPASGQILGATALPITGGYGRVDVPKDQCSLTIPGRADGITFASASAFVSGDYVDATKGGGSPVRTVAAAYVNGLIAGRLTARSLAAHLVLEDSRQDEPRISFGTINPLLKTAEPDQPIVDLAIDGKMLKIEFEPMLQQHHTLGGMQQALRDLWNFDWHGGVMATSIVKSLSWVDEAPKGANFPSKNSLSIPDFGTIYVGEMIVQKRARQLTLLRLQLGSDGQDNDCFCDVSTNGQGWPPVGN